MKEYTRLELARKIAGKIKDEYNVVVYSNFCDEGDIDEVPNEELINTIENVILEVCGED